MTEFDMFESTAATNKACLGKEITLDEYEQINLGEVDKCVKMNIVPIEATMALRLIRLARAARDVHHYPISNINMKNLGIAVHEVFADDT